MGKRSAFRCGQALAAVLALCLLCGCGGAPAEHTPEASGAAPSEVARAEREVYYAELIGTELGELRELGMFCMELEVDENGKVCAKKAGDGLLVTDEVELHQWPQSGGPFRFIADLDTGSGQITMLTVMANAQEDWETVTSPSGTEVYDRLDAIIDADMTLDDYCQAWAQYRGYESWELPEGVDGDTSLLDAPDLEPWANGIYDELISRCTPGLTISFYRAGETEPVPGYMQYNPTTGGPEFSFGEGFTRG